MTPENVNSQKPLLIWKINFSNPWNDTGGGCWYAKVFPTVSEYIFYEQTIPEVTVDGQMYSQLFQSIYRFYEQTIPEVTVDRQRYYRLFHRVNVDFMSRRYRRWLLTDKGIVNCFRVYVDFMSRRYQRWYSWNGHWFYVNIFENC